MYTYIAEAALAAAAATSFCTGVALRVQQQQLGVLAREDVYEEIRP